MPIKNIPFDFVLDTLLPVHPQIKPMFGCYGVYVGEKIMLILRKRTNHIESNGIWVATKTEHHKSLKKEFPSLCSISVLSEGKSETQWQMVSMDNDNFESDAERLCELILKNDERIGNIPKKKKSKAIQK